MKCAVIDPNTNLVVNLIMATLEDTPPEGTFLISDPPNWVEIGTPWDGTDFVAPPPIGTTPPDNPGLDMA